jgi:hypothetical protein
MNSSEFGTLMQVLARIAHATEALAKAADPEYKTLAEENPNKTPAQARHS